MHLQHGTRSAEANLNSLAPLELYAGLRPPGAREGDASAPFAGHDLEPVHQLPDAQPTNSTQIPIGKEKEGRFQPALRL
jgi:hypothetical protein